MNLSLNRESRELTAFKFKGRIFEYRGLCFGAPDAPGIYQRVNASTVNYARYYGCSVQIYIDDRLQADEKLVNGVGKNSVAMNLLVIASGQFVSLDKS